MNSAACAGRPKTAQVKIYLSLRRATHHSGELRITPESYASLRRATHHSGELCITPGSYASLRGAMHHSGELCITPGRRLLKQLKRTPVHVEAPKSTRPDRSGPL